MTNEELAKRIKNGEQELISALWEQNTGLIYKFAYNLFAKYQDRCNSSGVEPDDIVQCAFFALCDAVQTYDPESGFKLVTYMRFPLLNHFRALVGLRSSKRDPLNLCGSLNEAYGEDSDLELIDLQADPNSTEPFENVIDDLFQSELRGALEKAIDKLPANRAAIIRKRYFENRTGSNVACELGVSTSYVHSIEREALRKLYHERALKLFRDEILSHMAYKGTGYRAFRESFESSVERAVIKAEELTERKRGAVMR